jgi:ABC-type Zn uptake system ZnuABC Zn-binding protein ZnuA
MFRIALLALMVCWLGAAGCSPPGSRSNNGKPVAVATLTMIADMVAQVGGDRVEVRCIMKPGNDPHIYRPVPGDLKMIAESDIVFINGLGIEGWITNLINNAPGNRPVITVTDGVAAIRSDQFRGEPDPHCWFDVKNAIIYVNNIEKGLAAIDPSGADYYRQRADAYRKELAELDDWARSELAKVPAEKRKLVTSHDAFHYFGRAYGFEVLAVQGVSTESQPNSADVIALIKTIREANVGAVFVETSVNPKTLEHVARESGARIGGELFSDSCGDAGTPEGTYVGMMRHNVKTIVEALTK